MSTVLSSVLKYAFKILNSINRVSAMTATDTHTKILQPGRVRVFPLAMEVEENSVGRIPFQACNFMLEVKRCYT